jgi:glucokinase
MNEDMILDSQNLPLAIAVDLGGTLLRVAVLHGAKQLSRKSILTGKEPTPDRLIPRIHSTIEQALDEADKKLEEIAGIGIGIAGPLDSHTGIVFASPNLPGWDHIPLRTIFGKRYTLPVFVENDANVAALGEHMFGAGRGCKDMIYLTVSTGIGGGVIANDQLLEGTSGTAGELGHMTIDWRGERCNCGNIGCLESIASGTAIARRAREAMKRGVDFFARDRANPKSRIINNPGQMSHVNAEVVAQAARAGLPEACAIIKDAAEALGVGLVNLIHIFNPRMIVLGGGVTQMGSLLMDPALQIVKTRTMKTPYEAVRIMKADLGADSGLIGAGALIYARGTPLSYVQA